MTGKIDMQRIHAPCILEIDRNAESQACRPSQSRNKSVKVIPCTAGVLTFKGLTRNVRLGLGDGLPPFVVSI